VDDDADILAVLDIIFSEDGFRTTPCPSSGDAMATLRAERAELLVTDLRLAGNDGLSLIRIAISVQPSTKIILLTAARLSAYNAALPMLQSIGAEVINKPFDIDHLIGVARRVTGWPGKSSPR
jgi:two-component system nitrogen regulation response regulator GlnG